MTGKSFSGLFGTKVRLVRLQSLGPKVSEIVDFRDFFFVYCGANKTPHKLSLIVGTPTYNGCLTARMKEWLEDGLTKLDPAGKLGGAYATASYIHGGGGLAMQCVFTHMLVEGMMVYSSGQAKGAPVIHLGPVAIAPNLDDFAKLFITYGKRMAQQAAELH